MHEIVLTPQHRRKTTVEIKRSGCFALSTSSSHCVLSAEQIACELRFHRVQDLENDFPILEEVD